MKFAGAAKTSVSQVQMRTLGARGQTFRLGSSKSIAVKRGRKSAWQQVTTGSVPVHARPVARDPNQNGLR